MSTMSGEEFNMDDEEISELLRQRNALLEQLEGENMSESLMENSGDFETSQVNDEDDESDDDDSSSSSTSNSDESDPEENDEVMEDSQMCPVADEKEIDEMLEESAKNSPNIGKKMLRSKRVLLNKIALPHFDLLPDGWIQTAHSSGLPIYFHKPSRSCTFSRPYLVKSGSLRNHHVPESAIPCFLQKKMFHQPEQPQKESESANSEAVPTAVKVENADEIVKSQRISPETLYDYAKNLFQFKDIPIYRFNKWSDKRRFHKYKKRLNSRRNMLKRKIESGEGHSSEIKVISICVGENKMQDFIINPKGRSSISILHDFVQKILKCTVRYSFSETRNCATPYFCAAKIFLEASQAATSTSLNETDIIRILRIMKEKVDNQNFNTTDQAQQNLSTATSSLSDFPLEYNEFGKLILVGEGYGNSKKNSKLMAAKNAMEKLIVGLKFNSEGITTSNDGEGAASTKDKSREHEVANEKKDDDILKIFDQLDITDIRIPELCIKTGLPTPYILLQEYLKRYSTLTDTTIRVRSTRIRHQKHEYELRVGENAVTAICSNKREGKQKAAQALLKKFYPNIGTYGALIRHCGYDSEKQREIKRSRESVVRLQTEGRDQGTNRQPNDVILEKLKSEMLKLADREPNIRSGQIPNAEFLFFQ